MNFQWLPPAKQFAISLERTLMGKETKELGRKKANYSLSSVAFCLDKLVMKEEGQDAWDRADSWPAWWERGLGHLEMRVARVIALGGQAPKIPHPLPSPLKLQEQ